LSEKGKVQFIVQGRGYIRDSEIDKPKILQGISEEGVRIDLISLCILVIIFTEIEDPDGPTSFPFYQWLIG
jgi:hypothetical protein